MAVSGLEQRNAPLVLTSNVWSPWGPYMTQPYEEEDQVDGTLQITHQVAKRQSRKMTRSMTWGGYMTHAAEAYLVGSCKSSQEGSSPRHHYSSPAVDRPADNIDDRPQERHSEPITERRSEPVTRKVECSSDSVSLAYVQCRQAGSLTPRCTPETMCETASMESFPHHDDCHGSNFDFDELLVGEASPQPQYHAKQNHRTKFPTYHAPPVDRDVQDVAGPTAEVIPEKKRRPRRRKSASIQQAAPTSSLTTCGKHLPPQSGAPSSVPDFDTMDLNAAIDTQSMDAREVTTLVIRNLPRSLTQQELVQAMEESGYAGTWDFCYLPYKFQVRRNFGFAFVNFASPDLAQKFMQGWHQTRPFTFGRVRKPVNVAAASVQGREANEQKAHSLMGQVKNPAYQPVLL